MFPKYCHRCKKILKKTKHFLHTSNDRRTFSTYFTVFINVKNKIIKYQNEEKVVSIEMDNIFLMLVNKFMLEMYLK